MIAAAGCDDFFLCWYDVWAPGSVLVDTRHGPRGEARVLHVCVSIVFQATQQLRMIGLDVSAAANTAIISRRSFA